jgi:uncharacterized membrane protein
VLSVVGIALAFGERGLLGSVSGRAILGDALLLLTAFWGALYGVLSKAALARYSVLTVTTYPMLMGTRRPAETANRRGEALDQRDRKQVGLWLVLFVAVLGGALAFFLDGGALPNSRPLKWPCT